MKMKRQGMKNVRKHATTRLGQKPWNLEDEW